MATEQTGPRRGPGRPRTRPVEARRNVTFRANDQTYEQLTAAAKANGRSMSEEIERRIEQSFREPDLVKKAVLEVSFGSKKVAKVMEMIGVLARVAEARTPPASSSRN